MKYYLSILTLLAFTIGTLTFAQADHITKSRPNKTYIYYAFCGLGSNLGSFQPTFKLTGLKFQFTLEQNSYWDKKDKNKDVITTGVFRQSSIDSILNLVHNLKDSTIHETNFCVMSGGIHYLTVSNGIDTTQFQLDNTFDYTALKIVDIINQYLPVDKRITATDSLIIDQKKCEEDLIQEARKKRENK